MTTDTDLVEVTCRECRAPFRLDVRYWQSRGLRPARRCDRCLASRRARMTPMTGTVAAVAGGLVVRTSDGADYVAFNRHFEPGTRVTFFADAAAAPSGHLPFAYRVEVAR